jgi:hypothetical protein
MGLSRHAHEQLQEIITWGGTIVTLGAMYYLFIAPARVEASAPRRIPVKDLLAIKEDTVIPGLYPPPAPAAPGNDATGTTQLR